MTVNGQPLAVPRGLAFIQGAGMIRVRWNERTVLRIEREGRHWITYDRTGAAISASQRLSWAKANLVYRVQEAQRQGVEPFGAIAQ